MPKKKKSQFEKPFEDEFDDEISKSALKRESEAKQKLGESLSLLTDKQLDELNLSDTLRKAVEDLQRLLKKGSRAHGGMKRQKQYIGKLMRHTDVEPIQAKLNEWLNLATAEKAFLHRLENWRDRLINEDHKVIDDLYKEFDLQDQTHRQTLRQLQRQAKKEKTANKPPKSARQLFKLLRDEILIQE